MKRRLGRIFAVLLTLVICATLLPAQKGQSKGKGEKSGTPATERTTGDRVHQVLPPSEVVFTQRERVLVGNWFRTNRAGLPPGLAKRDRLPPGLEKQLRKRGTLPPGLQKMLQPVPVELDRQLQVLPTGWRRAVVAGNVILMNEKTSVVYDIIRNVIP
jgi:hypothetical protein